MPYRDAFAWSLRQLVQSGKTEAVLERRFAPRRLLGPRIMIRKGDSMSERKAIRPIITRPADGRSRHALD
jgi:hypothetical protein